MYTYTYIIIYNEQPVLQDSNNAAHTATQDSHNTKFSMGE